MNAAVQPQPAPTKRLKIAQVATSDISVRLLLLEHIEALTDAGHDVVAVCSAGEHMDAIRARNIQIETVPMHREPHPADIASLFALARCFRRHRFDVVHTHTPKAGLLGPLAARMAGVPMVVHTTFGLLLHDTQPKWRQLVYWLPEKFTSLTSHRLLSQSHEDMAVASAWKIASSRKLEYLGNGIDVARFRPASAAERQAARRMFGIGPNDFVIGSVGRLVYEKGFAELFAAAAEIKNQFPTARFLVVGPEEPDQSDAIPQHVLREVATRGNLQFLGWREEMAPFYAALDLFVLPSYREGIPRACLEAAASGVPVVASNIRGCREVVRDGETGLLCPLRDSEALAQTIAKLISNPLQAQAMGAAGRRHIFSNFDQRQVLQRLCSFYEGLAEEMQARERQ